MSRVHHVPINIIYGRSDDRHHGRGQCSCFHFYDDGGGDGSDDDDDDEGTINDLSVLLIMTSLKN